MFFADLVVHFEYLFLSRNPFPYALQDKRDDGLCAVRHELDPYGTVEDSEMKCPNVNTIFGNLVQPGGCDYYFYNLIVGLSYRR